MFKSYNTLEESNHSQPRVTALLSCQNNVMPVSWHMPISKNPFRYAVAVREENYTHHLLEKHGSFNLNFLPFEFAEKVDITGKVHGDKEDKLALTALEVFDINAHDNILLKDADFIYECIVCDTYQNGDHTIFVADVTKIDVNERQSEKPMLFMGKGKYTTTMSYIELPKR
ncbi:MAG: hypothetical protein RL113_519 [Pseudomonadota bacterium]|jgi:flavin reductase (DIM6/NTAB) family NADH-FMN oxidoreductase RutF